MYVSARLVGILLLITGLAGAASAQEVEPNNTCTLAQNVGPADGRLFEGSLDAKDATPRSDVDFLRYSATPGSGVEFFLNASNFLTTYDFYDESCKRIPITGPELLVPPSGIFHVAVFDATDRRVSGNGDGNFGSYGFSARMLPPFIGSISGRLVDDAGRPVTRSIDPLAQIEVSTCTAEVCSSTRVVFAPDEDGRFRITSDPFFGRIPAGTVLLIARAGDAYKTGSARVEVGQNEDVDVGDLVLPLVPAVFSNVVPCSAIAPQGSRCAYSVQVHNPTPRPVSGIALSFVRGSSDLQFEASTQAAGRNVRRARLTIPPLESRTVAFSFEVPAFLPADTELCVDLQFGLEESPLLTPERIARLFCVTKDGAGLHVVDPEEARP